MAAGGQRVACADVAALAAGIRPGIRLADARALVPGLATAPVSPGKDHGALERLAEWARRYTPWTGIDPTPAHLDPLGSGVGLWLDISGCAHLFGGETSLLSDLLGRLGQGGYNARGAAADTPGAAWAMVRHGLAPAHRSAIVPPGKSRAALAPLPMAALRLEPPLVEGLGRLGLRRIGDLYDLAWAPLTRRFGPEPAYRMDQALGVVDEPLPVIRETAPLANRLTFADPIGRLADLEAATRRLLDDLCRRLEESRLGVRQMELRLERVDGSEVRLTAGTSRPVRDVDHLLRLLAAKMNGVDSGFGIEAVGLNLRADSLAPQQTRIDASQSASATNGERQVDRLVDRLANRLGPEQVTRPQPVASHLPERASRAQPADRQDQPVAEQDPWRRYRAGSPLPPRPLRLLPQPWPIEVIAPVPDGPPALFRWRNRSHRVIAAEGPERIAPEWWRNLDQGGNPDRETRDYFRVEDSQGGRFWIFRLGLYPFNGHPRWYLHGMFG